MTKTKKGKRKGIGQSSQQKDNRRDGEDNRRDGEGNRRDGEGTQEGGETRSRWGTLSIKCPYNPGATKKFRIREECKETCSGYSFQLDNGELFHVNTTTSNTCQRLFGKKKINIFLTPLFICY